MCILHGHVLNFWWPCGKMLDVRESQCKLRGHMTTKNTWVGVHVNLVAIWPRNVYGYQTTLVSWPYGHLLNQTQYNTLKTNNYARR